MQDFKQRRVSSHRSWRLRGAVGRLNPFRRRRDHLPKGFRPLPVPAATRRPPPWRGLRLAWARPRLGVVHAAVVAWMAAGVCWNGWHLLTGPLEKVRLSGNVTLTGAEVLAAAALSPGLAMTQVDPITVSRLLSAHPHVAAADTRRVYPGALWIDLRERIPDLRVQAGETQAIVDSGNVVIGPAAGDAARALPVVLGGTPIPAPGRVLDDPGLERARELLRAAEAPGGPGSRAVEIDATHPYMLAMRLADGRRVVMSADHAVAELRAYAALAPALREVLAPGVTVDLRAATGEDGRVILRR